MVRTLSHSDCWRSKGICVSLAREVERSAISSSLVATEAAAAQSLAGRRKRVMVAMAAVERIDLLDNAVDDDSWGLIPDDGEGCSKECRVVVGAASTSDFAVGDFF